MGIWRAGFDVVGVDIEPQPRYPFAFVQADALRPPFDLRQFDFIWASPVCKQFTSAGGYQRDYCGTVYPNQIQATRDLLRSSRTLTCIENVPQAPIRADLVLDGTMFPALKVIRRRHFELSFPAPFALGFDARGHVLGHGWCCVVGNGTPSWLFKRGIRSTRDQWRVAMGIDWMTKAELSQAIPPAYSEFIARAAIAQIHRLAA